MQEKLNFEYLRLSKEDGDVADGCSEESQSIQSQRACIQQYRAAHRDLPPDFEELVDDGYSGTHFERPGMKKLLRLVKMGRVGTIIVRDLSRFARNFLDAGHYLEYVFPEYGVRFISINDGYDSDSLDAQADNFHIAIKNLMNQMYSRDISRKIKSAVDLKKLRGEFVYGTAPFGYKKGAEKNTIVIDEEAALIVRRIFSMACAGKTISQICRQFNEEGVVTPSVYLAAVRGKYKTRNFWTYEMVRNILSNRIYTGDTEPFKSHVVRVGSDRVKQIPEAERVVLPDTHDAIISREVYYQSRKIVKGNSKTPSKGKSSILASYLVCGCCGNKLAKGKQSNKSFLCANRRYHPNSDCANIRCDEEQTKEILLRAIRQQCLMMENHVQEMKSTIKKQQSAMDALQLDLKRQRRMLSNVQSEKMDLYESYISGQITKEDYLSGKFAQTEKEQSVKIQIALIEERIESIVSAQADRDGLEDQQQFAIRFKGITELDDALMHELVQKVIVHPGGNIHICWNFRDITRLPATIL